jgi:hypothetical protein
MEWDKNNSKDKRRLTVLKSKPKNWTKKHKLLSCGRSLQALSNASKDYKTKILADKDAKYFFKKLKKVK